MELMKVDSIRKQIQNANLNKLEPGTWFPKDRIALNKGVVLTDTLVQWIFRCGRAINEL